jgi:hypothetical protein
VKVYLEKAEDLAVPEEANEHIYEICEWASRVYEKCKTMKKMWKSIAAAS